MAKSKPCATCPDDECYSNIVHVCRCCQLVDGDETVKKVCWCGLCKAYICFDCRSNPKRIEAAVLSLVEKVEKVAEVISEKVTDIAEKIVTKIRGKKKDEESKNA